MTGSLHASVLIPTYNRAACLSTCLEAVASLVTAPTTFEIVVVDNNSSDSTREVALEFAKAHPALCVRYVCERQQGLSYARNRGVTEAKGEIVCFLDDDARPSPGWLDSLLAGFVDPAVGCAGGPAVLDYQGREVPSWLRGGLQGLLGSYGLLYAEPTAVSTITEFPFGCNMAFRKEVLADLGIFRTDLSRSGSQVLAAEDTEMIDRVHKAGWKVMYLPDATARHIVAPERLEKSYIYRVGQGLAASHIILTSDRRPHMVIRWFASDLWYATRLFLKLMLAVLRGKPLGFDDYMRFWMVAKRLLLRIQWLLHGNGVFNVNHPTDVEANDKLDVSETP